jgi:DNA-binding transcriptional MerR regulator
MLKEPRESTVIEIEKKQLTQEDLIKKIQTILYGQGIKFSLAEIRKILSAYKNVLIDCFTNEGYNYYHIPKFGTYKMKDARTKWCALQVYRGEPDYERKEVDIIYTPRDPDRWKLIEKKEYEEFARELHKKRFILKIQQKLEDVQEEIPNAKIIDIDTENKTATFGGFESNEEVDRGVYLISNVYKYHPAKFVFEYHKGFVETTKDVYNPNYREKMVRDKQRLSDFNNVYKSITQTYIQNKKETEATQPTEE